MNILLASKYAPNGARPIGGVQSWVGTVRDALKAAGHSVTTWEPGMPLPAQRFALGILANYGDTARVWGLCERTVCVSHGIIPAECPAPADRVLYTSEGVRDHWRTPGGLLRQPIDLSYWHPEPGIIRRGVVRYSYRGGLAWIPGVAYAMGEPFTHLRNVNHDQARHILQRAAYVLATGRAALEAMACGAPTVICDHRSAYQPPLMDCDLQGAMTRNYSGRGGVAPTPERVRFALEHAKPNRAHVARYHDAVEIANRLLGSKC